MHKFYTTLAGAILLTVAASPQDTLLKNEGGILIELSQRTPITILVAEGGCFSRREISVTLIKQKKQFFYAFWTSVWNSDDKKRYKYFPKRKANAEQLADILAIEGKYKAVKRKQDSVGSILFDCGGQWTTYAVLGKGKYAVRIEDSECEVNGFKQMQKTFGIKD